MPLRAAQQPAELGVQDVVVIAVEESTGLAAVAAHIAPLLGPQTIVISAMNGVPWWFFEGDGVPYQGARLQAIDPVGAIAAALPIKQVLGCVVHLSSTCPEPGLVQLGFGNGLILGEPDGASDRLRANRQIIVRCRIRCQRERRYPHRHLVQAVGQHDIPGFRDHRRDLRPPARRSAEHLPAARSRPPSALEIGCTITQAPKTAMR